MGFDNLPFIATERQDGGFAVLAASAAPRVLVLGVASQGQAGAPYVVGRTATAAVEFGSEGTLTRGMYEAKSGGAERVILYRLGATSASVSGIGVAAETGGIVIETALMDDSAGTDYEFFWNNTAKRLVVKNVDSGVTVYDRDFDDPSATIDLGEVYVSGAPGVGGIDIGDQYSLVTLAAAGAGAYNVGYTAGTDGTDPCLMQLYQFLFEGYKLLENEEFETVVPMGCFLDDPNVADGDTPGSYSGAYPAAGSAGDILLYHYAEEKDGVWYHYWRQTKSSGVADIYPAGYEATTPNGVTVNTLLFHEVNFAHQLASFCYTQSRDNHECIGMIGVRPPASLALADVSTWVGKLPTYTVTTAGVVTIASSGDDGSGLLGNKFMVGKWGFRANKAYGGFIATEDGYVDGTELTDRGGRSIDIGQFLSVCGDWIRQYNAFDSSGLGYSSSLGPLYAGFVSSLDSKSAPTNKIIDMATPLFKLSKSKLDALAGAGYVFGQSKPKGFIIADAPTGARPDSDYRRLTTVRIAMDLLNDVRQAADPFIGEASGAAGRAALQTAIESVIARRQKGGYITRAEPVNILATPAERSAGLATVEITVVPAFELRQITVVYSMRSV